MDPDDPTAAGARRPRWRGLLLAGAVALGVLAWLVFAAPASGPVSGTAGVMRILIDPETPQPVPAPGTPLEVLPPDMAAAAPRPLEVPPPVQMEPPPEAADVPAPADAPSIPQPGTDASPSN